jgi:hypothetical protein
MDHSRFDSAKGLATITLPQTFRYSGCYRSIYLIATCFFIALSVVASIKGGLPVLICFLPFVLPSGLCFFLTNVVVEVNEEQIGVRTPFRHKRIRWDEIDNVTSNILGDTLILSDREKKNLVRISSAIIGINAIMELARRRLPDLWRAKYLEHFHLGSLYVYIVGGSAILMILAVIKGFLEGQTLAAWVLLILVTFGLGSLFFEIREIHLQGTEIVLKYPIHEKRVSVSDLDGATLIGVNTIRLELKNAKPLTLAGFREGGPIFFNSLLLWWQKSIIRE